ncbi:hypothetical protein OC835_006899 [Tilletia horrida]|nr:hypothetical protein OC835_006899 [Tilletia horrida]
MSVSDSAELAALAVEFVHSLDNVPHQVSHMLKEIEHKDVKCQELLPKVADRELQYRKLINTLPPGPWTGLGGPNTSASQQGIAETLERADKLAEKINLDYSRLEEWAVQKAALSEKLWTILFAHHNRLRAELARVDPKVLANVPVPAPTPGLQPPLLAALSGFASAGSSGSSALGSALARSSTPTSAVGPIASGGTSGSAAAAAAESGTAASAGSQQKGGQGRRGGASGTGGGGRSSTSASGPSASSVRTEAADASAASSSGRGARQVDADGDVDIQEKGEGEEKDETPYCFCRQVSFGEMIGCDSDTCKIEWFHIGCVGVSKPLPATWYCEDCLKQMSSTTQKKRKRQV